MSRLIDGLVARDLVTRGPSPADRRRVVLALTPVGKAMLDEARRDTRAVLAGELAELPEADLLALAHALRALRPHLEAARGSGDE
jgi:MarR family transcriptional regulator, negative regulator of the multidrug operon emrRAB